MRKLYRKIQFLSNLATILIAVLLSLIAGKLYLFPTLQPPNLSSSVETVRVPAKPDLQPRMNSQVTPVGKAVPIQGIDWQKNKKTLVLYVSTKCHFCTESAPFYECLVKEHSSKNVNFMAVLPQSVDEGKDYLKGLGANIENVYNAQLSSIGVTATPTILLVDENGVVSDMWRGKLSDDKEKEVINKLSS
jgi:thiol-disulfide isomerase/thioredoxin